MSQPEVEDLLGKLSLAEKCRMLSGRTAWEIDGCERLGIPGWCVSDGPVGARGRGSGPGLVVPGPSAIAATWNVELIEKLGQALGQECLDREVDLLLAPTMNLHRSPRGGRHFESYSEDPELSARVAVAYIRGVQSMGVGACAKHYVANDQEFERFTIDVDVDERTLREIYLPPFEASVKEASVRSIMGAYNFVNGHQACAHEELLMRVLKDEWGFGGFVVSDWSAIKETVGPAQFGLDLEMPGPGHFWGKGKLEAAVEAGKVDSALIDDKVRRILEFLAWRGRLQGEDHGPEESRERAEHRKVAHRTACESMVLVKNEPALLPISERATVALLGPGGANTALLGGGSAQLRPHRTTNLFEALQARLGERLLGAAPGIDMRRRPRRIPDDWIEGEGIEIQVHEGIGFDGDIVEERTTKRVRNLWMGHSFPKGVQAISVRARLKMTPKVSGPHRICALGFAHAQLHLDGERVADNQQDGFNAGLGLHGGTGIVELEAGRTYELRLDHVPLRPGQWIAAIDIGLEPVGATREELLVEAETLAARADLAVVVVGSTSEWESEGGDRESIDLPNGQDELIERVRRVNENTIVVLNCGAPMNLPWLTEVPATLLAWYPGQEGGEALADVLLGNAEPAGRMPTTWAVAERDTPAYLNYPGEAGVVRYGEGIFVGYRHYDARGIQPRVPFGHGGSYTRFQWGEAQVSGKGTERELSIPIKNVGTRRGSEVVQVYVAPQSAPVPRPPKELAGFAKIELEPGEEKTASVTLRERSFARWDPGKHRWVVDPGAYELLIAASAVDVRGRIGVEIES